MIRERGAALVGRTRAALHRSFAEDYTPGQTAGSFAFGVFVTALPTVGTGLLLFVALAWLVDDVNELALVAAAVVFNPVVKWGSNALSLAVGVALLGPVEGVSLTSVSLAAGPEIVARMVLGSLVVGATLAAVSYVACHRLVTAFQAREAAEATDPADALPDAEAVVASDTAAETPPADG